LSSVKDFAKQIIEEETRLDVLVNNAGLSGSGNFVVTEDGFEQVYQANYLGPFLLTELLLPLLKKSTPARIVNTGSAAYSLGNVDPSKLSRDLTHRQFTMTRYGSTKLAMLMWTKYCGALWKEEGVTMNVVHPGVVDTNIVAKGEPVDLSVVIFYTNIFIFGRSAEEGAQTLIHCSVDENVADVSGRYFAECQPMMVLKGNNRVSNERLYNTTRDVLAEHLK